MVLLVGDYDCCENKELVGRGGGRSQDEFEGEALEVVEVVHLDLKKVWFIKCGAWVQCAPPYI